MIMEISLVDGVNFSSRVCLGGLEHRVEMDCLGMTVQVGPQEELGLEVRQEPGGQQVPLAPQVLLAPEENQVLKE